MKETSRAMKSRALFEQPPVYDECRAETGTQCQEQAGFFLQFIAMGSTYGEAMRIIEEMDAGGFGIENIEQRLFYMQAIQVF